MRMIIASLLATVSLCACLSPQPVDSLENAQKHLGGKSFTFLDKTGIPYGMSVKEIKLKVGKDFSTCSMDLGRGWEDGTIYAEVGNFVDTGEKYVQFSCSATGFKFATGSSDALRIYSRSARTGGFEIEPFAISAPN